jgi:superoxide dismutase
MFRILSIRLVNADTLSQGLNPSSKKLEIATTSNQDPLLTHVPIIGVDVWEHAYYLQYLNVRPDVRFATCSIRVLYSYSIL